MLGLLGRWLLDPSGLTPHGFCLLWQPWLIWTHVASDVAIGLAYLTIPMALMHFARRRHDLVVRPIFWLFAAFILLCGTTHLLSLLTIWVPAYGLEAVVKVATATVSLTTAVAVWTLMPSALKLPSQARVRAAYDALRESENRAQASYALTPLPLHVLDREGRVTAVSDRWLDLLGYARDEVVGRPITQFEEPASAARSVANRARLVAEGQLLDVPRRFVRRDGVVLDVLASNRVDRGADGAVRILGALVDVTERVRAEAALRESEERSRLALSAVNCVGAWDWDVPNDRVYADEPFARMHGVDPARAAAGTPRADYLVNLSPEQIANIEEEYGRAAEAGGDCSVVHSVVEPDGLVRWFVAKSHSTVGPEGALLRRSGVLIEITAQRALEDQLRQSQKMEAVGQLTGGLAHDFNNMLQGITGSLELLKLRMGQGRFANAERYIAAAQGDAGRASTLTQRLLAFSRRQVLDPKPIDADVLVAEMADLIRRTVGPETTVEAVATDGLWTTLCDQSQMENALLNLCNNAHDAMPGGGRLSIATANVRVDRRRGVEWDMAPGDYVAVSVADTGAGMPPQVVARAFDPFFTTKPVGEGTGLGLSMIYGFAQQSGGQARISSEVGRGTTVRVYLPRHLGERGVEGQPVEAAAAVATARAGTTVLVVDDEPTVRMVVTESLKERGYLAIEAADGAAGLQLLRSAVRIDLLVSDVGLSGGMDGLQLVDAARTVRPDLKVLFITGYASRSTLDSSRFDAGTQVVTKPFSLDALAAKIKLMVAQVE